MTAAPLITRIQPLKPRGLEVLVHLDRGEPLRVTLEALERHRLGVGDALPPERRHHLLNDDADVRVRDAALHLISFRARTRSELRRRLRQKGFRPARIDPCLDRLEAKGFIDDEAVAAAFVRDRIRLRPRGSAALSSELRAKGIPRDLADRTIEEVFEETETDDQELARSVAEKWIARQSAASLTALVGTEYGAERDKVRRRLRSYLARRGFRGADASAAFGHALELARHRVDDARG